MKDYKNEYEVYLKTEKKASKNTFESYMRDLTQYFSYLQSAGLSPLDADSEIISVYISWLERAGRSRSTLTRAIASLRCYYNFLFAMRLIKSVPNFSLHVPEKPKKFPEILTNTEVKTLLSQPDCTDLKGCRDKAMLELMYATGIKVSELIAITMTDINLGIGILHLRSAKSERVIPIYPEAVKVVENYINKVRDLVVIDPNIDNLFTNMNGKPLTRQGFWKIIKHYAALANINKDITPHTLRHSFAANLLENGAPLRDIQEILGHSDLSSTQIYAQLMRNRYARSYQKYHPMAK